MDNKLCGCFLGKFMLRIEMLDIFILTFGIFPLLKMFLT